MSTVLPGSLQILLDQTLGACFIGFLFTAILYGVTCIQTYLYFAKNARDEIQLKLIIVLLWILGTIQLIFITLALYHYMVDNFSNVLAVLIPFWSLPAMVALSATIECIVRGIFISRVWILSRSKWLTVVLSFLNLMVFIVGVVFSHKAFEFKTFLQFFSDGAWIVYLAFSTDFVLDILITVALSYYLLKIRYGFSSTTRFVNKLIITILNSGVMTSIMSLAVLTFFAANQNSFGFMAVYFPLSQVFYNALLASLNLRESLRDERAGGAMELTVSETRGGESSVRRPVRVPFMAGARQNADDTLIGPPMRHIAVHMEKNISTDLAPNRGPPYKDYPEAVRGKETIISMA